ncbi:exonuclease domain-containing protein [Marinicella meishanensis]|uniref:exonuclease domain-containing protein n=1 Tax=Marinicella meishanensis TaxID=2873263 RepID=UPI001CBE3742|nr:exonuclease domain-containing protein [Marinicella sp. NBU2979]
MFDWFNHNKRLLQHALKHQPQGALKHYLTTPLPDLNQPALAVDYLVLDFETTGLNPYQDHIISLGYTHISQGRIQLKQCRHALIKTNKKLTSDNVSIHQITDDDLAAGIDVQTMMEWLLTQMAGKALAVHYQKIEHDFLQQLSLQLYGHRLPLCVVDTLAIERRYLERQNQPIQPNQLRLFNLREQYHLPRYHAHNALEDALATAELLLAQIKHRQRQGYPLKLKDISH